MALDWTEEFHATGPITSKIAVKGTLDSGGREALNFPSAAFLSGPTTINATLTGHRGSLLTADMEMDLASAALNLDLIGLNKPEGFPASAHITASFGPESAIKAETMTVTGPGVSLSGNAAFDKDGPFAAACLPFALGEQTIFRSI
ncbi:MAG: hypothetical protein WDM89_15820 [Rhizomicrobium sp.]